MKSLSLLAVAAMISLAACSQGADAGADPAAEDTMTPAPVVETPAPVVDTAMPAPMDSTVVDTAAADTMTPAA